MLGLLCKQSSGLVEVKYLVEMSLVRRRTLGFVNKGELYLI